MKPKIEVIVSPQGEVKIDAIGYKGPACEKATRFLEGALGVITNRVKKPEYLVRNTTRTHQHIGE